MAKSRAKKLRDKLVREGRMNPEESRSPFTFMDLETRKTKTKKDRLYRCKHKNQSSKQGYDGSFYFYPVKNALKKYQSATCFFL